MAIWRNKSGELVRSHSSDTSGQSPVGCFLFLFVVAILGAIVYCAIVYPSHRFMIIVGVLGAFLEFVFLGRLCFGPKYVASILGPTERNKTGDWLGVIVVPLLTLLVLGLVKYYGW